MTTVSAGLVELFVERHGRRPEVVMNASAYIDQDPRPLIDGMIRLVHVGG